MTAGNTATPYVIAVVIQLVHGGAYIVAKAALDQGLNPFILTFYRQAAATVVLLPMAIVFQRKNASSLSPRLLAKLFFCALIGITSSTNLCNVSMTLTSATVATATANSVPVFTFCFALLFRMEAMKLRTSSGLAKLAGVGLCLAGVFTIAFYAGPALPPVTHHRAFAEPSAAAISDSPSRSRVEWIKGTFLMVLSSMAWSLWAVMQAGVLKECSNKVLVTVTQCVFSAAQLLVVAVVAERDFSQWRLGLDVSLLAILYNGIVVSGVSWYLEVWCMEMKGPVFLAVWTPLSFVFTILCSSFFLGETIHLGSAIAGALLVCGLYSVLWGKSNEEPATGPDLDPNKGNGIRDGKCRHHEAQQEEQTVPPSAAGQV